MFPVSQEQAEKDMKALSRIESLSKYPLHFEAVTDFYDEPNEPVVIGWKLCCLDSVLVETANWNARFGEKTREHLCDMFEEDIKDGHHDWLKR